MPDFYKKITEMQGSVEQLARRVPGFGGYLELEDRRAADRLLRGKLALTLEKRLSEFSRLQRLLVEGSGIRYMDRAAAVERRLRTLVDKVESAADGYAGLFDAVKIDSNALERVYAFDNALFTYEDQLATGLKRLGEVLGTEGVSSVLDELDLLVEEAGNTFARRGEAMRGLEDGV